MLSSRGSYRTRQGDGHEQAVAEDRPADPVSDRGPDAAGGSGERAPPGLLGSAEPVGQNIGRTEPGDRLALGLLLGQAFLDERRGRIGEVPGELIAHLARIRLGGRRPAKTRAR